MNFAFTKKTIAIGSRSKPPVLKEEWFLRFSGDFQNQFYGFPGYLDLHRGIGSVPINWLRAIGLRCLLSLSPSALWSPMLFLFQ